MKEEGLGRRSLDKHVASRVSSGVLSSLFVIDICTTWTRLCQDRWLGLSQTISYNFSSSG